MTQPPDGHPDSYALQVASDILSSGESSRLYKRLVYEEQVATAFTREQRAFVTWRHLLLRRRQGPIDIAVDRGDLGFDQGTTYGEPERAEGRGEHCSPPV